MKKNKIQFNKLNVIKERISSLQNIIGGGPGPDDTTVDPLTGGIFTGCACPTGPVAVVYEEPMFDAEIQYNFLPEGCANTADCQMIQQTQARTECRVC